MNRYIVSLKKTAGRVKEHFPRWSRKAAVAASAAAVAALPVSSWAVDEPLPAAAQALLDKGVGYLGSIATGIGTLGIAAIGIVILLGVIGVVMMFARRPAG